ncbi:bile acid cotransporter 7 [Seminavis robusta]|uniref:Bile acid cotransporter 7 n=1 Tax=Seminavis robusta TaxID=568900 RepID=A0A9N8EQ89_9STRA|nr:bile acid cotransporter 7 [Seminavis robusta]|eukprot:Sro1392_g268840.1 bile acid cotransporter 7 (429) ;mRNA; f:13673-14959
MSAADETTPLRSIEESTEVPRSLEQTICDGIVDFLRTNSFVIKAGLAICLAKLYPPLGAIYLCPQITATWLAVIFIFCMAGLSLQSKEFARAATRLWFNVYVLTFNFCIVSLLVFGMTRGIRYLDLLSNQGLLDGMMVCACMPITVTMVIVLTKSAKGDEAAAVLLAAVGSLLGVIVTPALLLAYIGVQSDVSFPEVFLKLVLRVVVPLLVGQLLQTYSSTVLEFVTRNKPHFKGFQEWALIFIVYTVFCKTFSKPIKASIWDVLLMALFQGTALVVSMLLAWFSLKLLFRNEPRLRVMGLYGCTQKSVAVGIPMISALYEHDPHAGLYTLPLLIWHPLQLLIGSALAPELATGVERLEGYLATSSDGTRSSRRRSFFTDASVRDSFRQASSVAFTTPSQLSWPLTTSEQSAGGDALSSDAPITPVLE